MLRTLFFITRLIFILLILGIITVIVAICHFSKDLPDHSQLKAYYPPCTTRIYSADGILIEEYAKEKRVFIPVSNIPQHILQAFIAAEDKNFYNHPGIDILGIIRAGLSNIIHIINGTRFEGGSTITQQVVKNFLLTSERSFKRKIKEIILSYMISQTLSKDQILELYLNQLFLGKGYGIAMGALGYFNKSVEELSIAEAAFLASLAKAPSQYGSKKNYERTLARRNYIINRMYDDGYISKKEAEKSKNEPLITIKQNCNQTISADYYAEKVRSEVIEMFGEEYFYTAGLTVISCLDSKLQKGAASSLRAGIKSYDMKRGYRGPLGNISLINWREAIQAFPKPSGLRHYEIAVVLNIEIQCAKIAFSGNKTAFIYLKDMSWAKRNLNSIKDLLKNGDVIVVEKRDNKYTLQQIPEINGAIMVVEPYTGKVLAAEGGYDYDSSKFDRITQAQRQPGSLIKPFVYLAALEEGIKPNDLFLDSPIEIHQGEGIPVWKPRNWDNKFMGSMTLREGLEQSRNSITVRIGQILGLKKISDTFKRFGINDNPATYIHSIVLGSIETTLEKMTIAYGIIASKGRKLTPHYIELIQDRKGNILYRRDYSEYNKDKSDSLIPPILADPPGDIITDEATSYQITSILTGVIQRGTAQAAKTIHKTVAGKTGTSNCGKDAWFIGFTPKLVVGTYIGYDIPRSLGKNATGAGVALPIFINFMKDSYKNTESIDFEVPKSIKLIPIINTGKTDEDQILEAFKMNDSSEDLTNTDLDTRQDTEDLSFPLQEQKDKVFPLKEDDGIY